MDTYEMRPGSPSPSRGNNDRMNSPVRSNSKERSPSRRDDKNEDPSFNRNDRDSLTGEYRNRLANTAEPSSILGVFGLAQRTSERDLKDEFTKFGKIGRVDLIMDRKTGQSKCFAFVYFENKEDAVRAKEDCQGLDIHGKKIRTDYSATKKAHDPTPGRYFGNPRNDTRRSPPRYSPYGGGRPFREDRYGGGGGRGGDRYSGGGRGGEDRYGGGGRGGDDRYGGRGEDRYREDRYSGGGRGGEDRYRSGSGTGSGDERYSRNDERYRSGSSNANGTGERYRSAPSGGEDRYRSGTEDSRDRYRSAPSGGEDRYRSGNEDSRDRYGTSR